MAGIVNQANKKIFCGATIIASQYALTAAHCVHEHDLVNLGLVVGEYDVSTGKETNATKLYRFQKIVSHPLFDGEQNDIAVIKIFGNILFNTFVGPICLPFRYENNDFNGQVVTTLGWGLLEFGGHKSGVLQSVDLNIISNQKCKADLSADIISSQLCTFTPGKDTCQMDSGGPLFYHNTTSNRLQLVGIISSGIGCASNKPSINTRVSSFLNWIVSLTPDAQYCLKY